MWHVKRFLHWPFSHSPGVATVARRLRIDVHNNNDDDDDDNNDNAWQFVNVKLARCNASR